MGRQAGRNHTRTSLCPVGRVTPCAPSAGNPVPAVGRGRPTLPGSRGFTLLELLLVVVLLMGLLGAVAFNFNTLERGATLDEGASQFEALVRFARAQAASQGRQVRFQFDEAGTNAVSEASGTMQVMWEPFPIEQPGLFEPMAEAAAFVRELRERVQILSVTLESRGETNEPGVDAVIDLDARVMIPPVTFYPDGSSDSAEIVLGSLDDTDRRKVAIRLTGITGGTRRETHSPTEEGGFAVEPPATNEVESAAVEARPPAKKAGSTPKAAGRNEFSPIEKTEPTELPLERDPLDDYFETNQVTVPKKP